MGEDPLDRERDSRPADQRPGPGGPCACFDAPHPTLLKDYLWLGMDSRYAEVSVLACRNCGQHWLRYFYEHQAFSSSGRWYLGPVTAGQLAGLTAEGAKSLLEGLDWYFYGGSYYGGRSGKASGEILLFP